MEYLQQEIKIDIFSRLPIDSVLNCKLVCKSWYSLLHLPYFADMHLHHQLLLKVDNVGFLFLTPEKSSPLCYLEYDERKRSYTMVKRINHPQIKKRGSKIAMVGSCNGLICFSEPSPRYGIDDPIYICNPLTNECINLPKFNILRDYEGVPIDKNSSYDPGRTVSGFGYHPLTKEYKIVRIIYYDVHSVGRVQVYTLGSGSGWINKGEIIYSLVDRTMLLPVVTRGILANGALHWIDFKEWRIVAFDLADDEWSVLPLPPFVWDGAYREYQLRVLGGCLCALQLVPFKVLNVFSFKKSGKWENIFSIPCNGHSRLDTHWPITFTFTGDLLLRRKKGLIRYNRKTETIEELVEKIEDLGTHLHLYEGIHHTNSFVSLKALGEISRKIRNDDNPTS